jgi:hypothetical protein
MWERWRKGESLQKIAQLFDRNHSSVQGILAETGGIQPARRQAEYNRRDDTAPDWRRRLPSERRYRAQWLPGTPSVRWQAGSDERLPPSAGKSGEMVELKAIGQVRRTSSPGSGPSRCRHGNWHGRRYAHHRAGGRRQARKLAFTGRHRRAGLR